MTLGLDAALSQGLPGWRWQALEERGIRQWHAESWRSRRDNRLRQAGPLPLPRRACSRHSEVRRAGRSGSGRSCGLPKIGQHCGVQALIVDEITQRLTHLRLVEFFVLHRHGEVVEAAAADSSVPRRPCWPASAVKSAADMEKAMSMSPFSSISRWLCDSGRCRMMMRRMPASLPQ